MALQQTVGWKETERFTGGGEGAGKEPGRGGRNEEARQARAPASAERGAGVGASGPALRTSAARRRARCEGNEVEMGGGERGREGFLARGFEARREDEQRAVRDSRILVPTLCAAPTTASERSRDQFALVAALLRDWERESGEEEKERRVLREEPSSDQFAPVTTEPRERRV